MWYVVAEDERTYNVFSSEDFDDEGVYLVNPEYSLEDMDIVEMFRDEQKAWDFADKLNNQ